MLPEGAAGHRVQAHGGFVQEKEPGPVNESLGEFQAPDHAAGKRADQGVGPVGQLQQVKESRDAPPPLGCRNAV